jgi:predicted Zn-dependent peptidase
MTATLLPRPEPGPSGTWSFPAVTRTPLPNGLTVATCHLPGQAVIELRLIIDGGARSDPSGLEGLSLLTGRALVESTSRLGVDDFANEVESLGARIGSQVHWDATVVAASAPQSRLSQLLRLVAEVVLTPGFGDADVQRVVRSRQDEAVRSLQYPQARVGDTFNAAAFATGSRRAVNAGGSPASLAAIDPSSLASHWTGLAQSGGATTLAVVGDLAGVDVEALVASAFEGWAAGSSAGAGAEPAPVEVSRRGALSVVDIPGAVQTQLVVGLAFDSIAVDERPALRVAVHALGGHFNSTLMNVLREERGVTYGVHASIDHAGGAGTLDVDGAVQADATAESVVEIVRQLQEATVRIDDVAIAHAVDNLVRTGPTSFRSGGAVAAAVVRNTIEGLPDDYDDRVREALAATTPADAAAGLAAVYRPGEVVVAAVGDASSIAAPLGEALGMTAEVEPV